MFIIVTIGIMLFLSMTMTMAMAMVGHSHDTRSSSNPWPPLTAMEWPAPPHNISTILIMRTFKFHLHRLGPSGNMCVSTFLPDPGVSGVRSMDPGVSN